MRKTRHSRGFTLIEVIVALAILGIAGLGALQAMLIGSQSLAQGRFQDIKGSLAEAHSEALLLENRSTILNSFTAVAPPSTLPILPALGSTPWVIDPSGAYFTALSNGTVTTVLASSITNTTGTCGDSGIPAGTFCREMMITIGMPTTYLSSWEVAGTNPSWGTVYTLWTRVSRKPATGQDHTPAVYVEMFTQ